MKEISFFYLVPVAEQAGLSLALSETQRQVFLQRGPLNKIQDSRLRTF